MATDKINEATPVSDYSIPLKYRKLENLHIVFWLLKDVAWCALVKPLGIAMVLPTLFIAVLISYRTRENISEFCHNLAIVLWITANSYWMISEFLAFDTMKVIGNVTYKNLALIPFLAGVAILAWYYLWWRLRNKNAVEML